METKSLFVGLPQETVEALGKAIVEIMKNAADRRQAEDMVRLLVHGVKIETVNIAYGMNSKVVFGHDQTDYGRRR